VRNLFEGYAYDDDFQLVLQIAGVEKKIRLGEELRFSLSGEKYCVECGKQIIHDSLCYECGMENEWQECLKCDGSLCTQDDKETREHCSSAAYCVYLASFGSIVKAGVSLEERALKRWVEQGADYAVKIASGLNGKTSRVLETQLFAKGFRAFVKASEKIEIKPNAAILENAVEKIRASENNGIAEKNLSTENLNPVIAKIVSLSDYHKIPTRILGKTNELCGFVSGWKGPVLYLGEKAFLLQRAVGREVVSKV
jgi:hypothetical protein